VEVGLFFFKPPRTQRKITKYQTGFTRINWI
jgi:hypothetical protein